MIGAKTFPPKICASSVCGPLSMYDMRPHSKAVSDFSSAHRSFPETHWSVVLTAGAVGGPMAEEALEKLCRAYWYPLYAFARKQGYSPSEAEDSTQSFFAVLLEENFVGKARLEKGKFRSFLLASFKNFLSQERERDQAQKRGAYSSHEDSSFGDRKRARIEVVFSHSRASFSTCFRPARESL